MKKSELVTLVAEKTGFSKKDTEKTIDTVFTAIADIIAALPSPYIAPTC